MLILIFSLYACINAWSLKLTDFRRKRSNQGSDLFGGLVSLSPNNRNSESFQDSLTHLGVEAMAQSNSEADKMLDVYIYDYLVKKKLYNTADSFMTEANVSLDPAAIDTPGGFLFDRWSMFWDICYAKTKEKHSESAVEYGLNVYIYDYLVKNHLYYTAKSFMTEVNVSPSHAEINTPGGFLSKWWYVFWAFFIARMNEKPSESAAQENNSEVNLGASPRQLPVNPSTVYGQGILPRMGSAGSNPGVGALPLKGWPLTGLDNMRQDLGPQGQRAFLQNQGQFQLPPQQQQQQQIMARDQGQGNMTNSSMYGQQNANDGSIGYPVPLNSSKPINMPPVQQYSSQQQDPLLSQQNNRKRTRTGNTVGPFNSQSSTPLTHTPIEGVAITGNMPKGPVMYVSDAIGDLASSANQLLWEVWDDIETFEDVGALEDTQFVNLVLRGGLPSSGNQLDDMEAFKDVDVESLFDTINWNPSEFKEAQKAKENEQKLKAGEGKSPKRLCTCKKSKCLKLYCECFAAGVYCSTVPPCSCTDCNNTPLYNETIFATRKNILSRNPLAFSPKIFGKSSDSVQKNRDDASKTPASGRHIRGCNCKKSNCSNKYCECFQGGVGCSRHCRCELCKNKFNAKRL